MKEIVGILSVTVGMASYFPYVRSMLKKETTPHTISWFIWALTTGVGSYIQFQEGGGSGSRILLFFCIINTFIFLYSFRRGDSSIDQINILSLGMAILALITVFVFTNPLIGVIIISFADGFGFIPTFRQAYKRPSSESLLFWFLTVISLLLSLVALQVYNTQTILYTLTMAILEIMLIGIIIGRKKVFSNQ